MQATRVRLMGAFAGRKPAGPGNSVSPRLCYARVACTLATILDRSIWTAIVSKDDEWWIGWIAELPGVNAQERTRDALLESLAEVLAEALRMNREQARALAREGYEQVPLAL